MDPKVLLFSTVRMWWEIDANVKDIKAFLWYMNLFREFLTLVNIRVGNFLSDIFDVHSCLKFTLWHCFSLNFNSSWFWVWWSRTTRTLHYVKISGFMRSVEINIWNLSYVKAKSLKLVASQYFYALILLENILSIYWEIWFENYL
jgi:hypothetical protein